MPRRAEDARSGRSVELKKKREASINVPADKELKHTRAGQRRTDGDCRGSVCVCVCERRAGLTGTPSVQDQSAEIGGQC